jgi:predicted choloylglycine hydrolase
LAKILGKDYSDIRVVTVSGRPYDMGMQHGRQLGDLIRAGLRSHGHDLDKSAEPVKEDAVNVLIEKHREIVNGIRPELFEEMEGVAEGAGADYDSLLGMFLGRELPYGIAGPSSQSIGEECTAWLAAGEATVGMEPMLAQNRDCPYDSGQYRIVILAKPAEGNSFVATGRAGSNDGYGVNDKGLAISSPAVRPSDSVEARKTGKPPGVQSYSLARMVLQECSSVGQAIDLIKRTPPGYMGLNWMLADKDNEVARVERSFTRINIVYPEDASYPTNKVIGSANHYSSREMSHLAPAIRPSTKMRYDRIATLLTSRAGQIDFNSFKGYARDHANGPGHLSICNHGDTSGTNLSMIAQCRRSRLWVLRGSPCLNEFVAYDCPG